MGDGQPAGHEVEEVGKMMSIIYLVLVIPQMDKGVIDDLLCDGLIVQQIENEWKDLAPNLHFDYSFMDEDFEIMYRTEQRMGNLFIAFTTLAIIIACLGLFSLAAYAAEQRNREIGIRKVLGASVPVIVKMLSKDFVKLVIISFLIAAPLAWLIMNKWLQGFAYRQNIQWWVLLVAGIGSLVITFITISTQSFKAAMANPVDSLKNE